MEVQVAELYPAGTAFGGRATLSNGQPWACGADRPARATTPQGAAKDKRVAASDEELARRSAGGDVQAYEVLVARYARPLYHAAYRILGDSDDAADAAQEALIQLYVALPRTRLDLPLRPWLFRVCRNRCLDLRRRRRALPFSAFVSNDDSPNPVERVPDGQPPPEEIPARRDLQAMLGAAIISLPNHYRDVVALRYMTDMTFGEIAAILGLPENTVKTHFHRAKAALRRFLLKRGLGDEPQGRGAGGLARRSVVPASLPA